MAKTKISTTTLVHEDSHEIANVVINVSEKYLHLSKTKKYRKTKRQYFDKECHILRIEVQRLGHLLSKSPNNISLRKSYHQTGRNYQYTLKIKHRRFEEQQLKRIGNLKSCANKKNGISLNHY